MRSIRLLVSVLLLVLAPPTVASQPAPSAGSIVHELVHSPALEGNLLEDTADQPVALYLPPGYADTSRRYPVLYLRGFHLDTVFVDEFSHIPPSTRMLADTLAELGVPHVFEMYEGDHRSRMRERMTTLVVPWFSEMLEGESVAR